MGLLDVKDLSFHFVESPARREAIYRLRYDVWVTELSHAQPLHFPKGMITDELDAVSLHAAALRGPDPVAAIRLIPPTGKGLPIHRVINVRFSGRPEPTGEISHLVISKIYRRRKEDGPYGAEPELRQSEGGSLPDQGPLAMTLRGRKGPRLILGLFRLIYQASKQQGLTRWFCLADVKLFTLLTRYGMPFRQMADRPPDYPDRIPASMLISEFEDRLRRLDPALFEEFTQ